ncbi:MAG: outer membrane lipoprotein carrier protein LolA [Desulfobulbaceae bacterium]|nr:MAG: outer membrane lipoprotein carrier protein LolA [Desulfobulbaceae bacterium]
MAEDRAVEDGAGRESREETVVRRLQQAYDQVTGFRADFRQLTLVPMSRRQREGAGTVIFRKPHQMRWEYTYPDHQVLVGDGREIRLYFADSNQMFISDVEDHLDSDVTYAFFAGSGDLLRDFKVEEASAPMGLEAPMPAPAGEWSLTEGYNLRLIPRVPHPQVDHINLGVADNPFFVHRIEIVDHFGSVNILTFSNIELDPDLPTDFYHFEPPPNTEILGP